MDLPPSNLIQFLARFGVLFVMSGLWMAYVADQPWWLGGAAGFGVAAMLGVVVSLERLRRRRQTRVRSRDRLEDLLSRL
ncbi:MAG: hypothetical protein V2I57_07110 [Xanthomonadales bacterium]|jgi:hypothetical protein|nr:hypothetical protein [Xanthomonadales bacterium]